MTQKLQRLKYWWQTRGAPFVKKNKVPLIISAAAIVFIIIFLIKIHKDTEIPKDRDRAVKTEDTSGLTGKDVKKILLAWNKKDRKAYIVADAAQILYHYEDSFQNNPYSVLVMDGMKTYEIETDAGDMILWGINYGNVLRDDSLNTEGGSFYSPGGLLKKKVTTRLPDKNNTKVTLKKTTNPYTIQTGITIPDDEHFRKKKIVNNDGKEIGTVFYPTKILAPNGYRLEDTIGEQN